MVCMGIYVCDACVRTRIFVHLCIPENRHVCFLIWLLVCIYACASSAKALGINCLCIYVCVCYSMCVRVLS